MQKVKMKMRTKRRTKKVVEKKLVSQMQAPTRSLIQRHPLSKNRHKIRRKVVDLMTL